MSKNHITILGGGPAGLAAGYFAARKGLPFTIYEARNQAGGNAVTIEQQGFRFDSGAHRFHDKDPEITREVKTLLGSELLSVARPSHIYDAGRFIDFPLSPLNLIRTLDPLTLARALGDLVRARLTRPARGMSFESAAVGMYGRTIAERFLLSYSEKLWGLSCDRLSVSISGARLKGMDPLMLLREVLFGSRAKPAHLEGRFYYPRLGYGMIAERLAQACGAENIHLGAAIRALHHASGRVRAISLQNGERVDVDEVVSTLPLSLMFGMLEPGPPAEYLSLAKSLRFRNVVVVALFLDRERVTESATIYFPEPQFPFTRLYEPINRSRAMAPEGKSSVCLEYPCFSTDHLWQKPDDELIESTRGHLERIGLIQRRDFLGGAVVRLPHAYPVLETGIEEKLRKMLGFLTEFENLKVIGRNGQFVYAHVHDMLRFGMDVVDEIAAGGESHRTQTDAVRSAIEI